LANFVSTYINYEARVLAKARLQQERMAAQPPEPQAKAAEEPKAKRIGQSAMQHFRDDYMARLRAQGHKALWSASLWPDIQQAFEELPEDRRREYEVCSVASKSQAKMHREVAKHNALAKPSASSSDGPGRPGPLYNIDTATTNNYEQL
jgi:hypothetical protein